MFCAAAKRNDVDNMKLIQAVGPLLQKTIKLAWQYASEPYTLMYLLDLF